MDQTKPDPRVGKYYYIRSTSTHKIPLLLYVESIEYSEKHHAKVYIGKLSSGVVIEDRAVMLGYYREATPTEIMFYWPKNRKEWYVW